MIAFFLVPARGRLLNPVLLRFADPGLERHYRDDRLNFRLNAVRVGVIAGAGLWLLFTLLDEFAIRDPSQPLLYIRLTMIVGLLVLGAATFVVRPERWTSHWLRNACRQHGHAYARERRYLADVIALLSTLRHLSGTGGFLVRSLRCFVRRGCGPGGGGDLPFFLLGNCVVALNPAAGSLSFRLGRRA